MTLILLAVYLVIGLLLSCFECQPLTDEEVYGQVTAHD